ncbi:MAG: acetamidase [Firmicutes bacterium]|nr:acetamidase [Bacillota bacterium]
MAKTHHFVPERYHLTLGSHEPVLVIAPGDTVLTSTVDASGCDSTGEKVVGHGNAQTGPFYIQGAEPGDILSVKFERIWPNRTYGYSGCGLSSNVVEPAYVREIPGEGDRSIWNIDLKEGTATLQRPKVKIDPFVIALNPMMGSFGVAPAGGQAISARTGGNYGGNMDYRGVVPGTTIYFPVFVKGALFHVGDGHAAQGDGEILGRGIEVSVDVTFSVDLIKNGGALWPRGENEKEIFTIGNVRPLHQALQHATTEMLRWLQKDFQMDAPTAHMLLGQYVRYQIGNVFNPAYTVVCKLEKKYLP